jgi:hypothetical protein
MKFAHARKKNGAKIATRYDQTIDRTKEISILWILFK